MPRRRARELHGHLGRRPVRRLLPRGRRYVRRPWDARDAVAPGRVEHYNNCLDGLSYRLYADDGTFYYGTHLSA